MDGSSGHTGVSVGRLNHGGTIWRAGSYLELKLGDSWYELKLFKQFKELVQASGMQLQSGKSTSK